MRTPKHAPVEVHREWAKYLIGFIRDFHEAAEKMQKPEHKLRFEQAAIEAAEEYANIMRATEGVPGEEYISL